MRRFRVRPCPSTGPSRTTLDRPARSWVGMGLPVSGPWPVRNLRSCASTFERIGGCRAVMFGTPRRVPRPVLLILVYGIFLVIVGLTSVTQTVLVSADFSATTLNSTVGADAALVRLFVTSSLSPDDLGPAGLTPDRQATLDQRLAYLVQARPDPPRRGPPAGRPGPRLRPRRLARGRGTAIDRLRDRPDRPDRDRRHRRRGAERGGRRAARGRSTSCASTSRS